jgi:hypothetical protein
MPELKLSVVFRDLNQADDRERDHVECILGSKKGHNHRNQHQGK